MHGRPRKALKPEEEATLATKATELRALQAQFLHNHRHQIYDKEALEVSAKLLGINPESYTAWNYRKLAVDSNLSVVGSDPDSVQSILNEELRVVETALKQNFKSYGAWHHRKWVLSKGHSSVDHELRLLDRFQKADSRNFHAWNYRRFVASLKSVPEVDELKYTTDMIERNFSNYSAWHNRSVILSSLLKRKAEGFSPKEKVLVEEYELVHQAIFTDPDDQSGWFYYLWLLDQTVKLDGPSVIFSWPAHGSEVVVSVNGSTAGDETSHLVNHYTDREAIPLVLFFNEYVKGLNSSTVTTRSAHKVNRDLTWIPLSTNKNNGAQAWVAYLDTSDVQFDPSETHPVEVSLEQPKDIISLSGFHLRRSFTSKYAIRVHHSNFVDDEDMEISWKDCDYEKSETDLDKAIPAPGLDCSRVDDNQVVVSSTWREDMITNEIALFRDLLSETNCKIGKLTLARLLTALDTVLSDGASNSNQDAGCEEVLSLYSDLIKLDPLHSECYRDERSLALLRQITSSRESLLRYCWCYKDATPSEGCRLICVRLNNLSITRIGSVERLLWVQMLDLSFNGLRSIDGLEAMQSLRCLNLSNNKLRSFTSLDPLRKLKSLRVLNVSNNEIGKHSIDTTRYSCSSPLSHTGGSDWNLDEFPVNGTIVAKHWEACLVFKDLNLKQLDVMGNTAVDEDFKLLLSKLMPQLRWLDGHSLNKISTM